jgi:hypothetical protein
MTIFAVLVCRNQLVAVTRNTSGSRRCFCCILTSLGGWLLENEMKYKKLVFLQYALIGFILTAGKTFSPRLKLNTRRGSALNLKKYSFSHNILILFWDLFTVRPKQIAYTKHPEDYSI